MSFNWRRLHPAIKKLTVPLIPIEYTESGNDNYVSWTFTAHVKLKFEPYAHQQLLFSDEEKKKP